MFTSSCILLSMVGGVLAGNELSLIPARSPETSTSPALFRVMEWLQDNDKKGTQLAKAIQLAIERGDEDAINETLDERKSTALHEASKKGNTDIAILLLGNEKVEVNARNKYDQTPLNLATSKGKTDIVKLLLGNEKVEVNAADILGNTPLHLASSKENNEMVQVLLEKEAYVNARNEKGQTPLYLAFDEETRNLLLGAGAGVYQLCGVTYRQQEMPRSGSFGEVFKAHVIDEPKKVVEIKLYKWGTSDRFKRRLWRSSFINGDMEREIKALRVIQEYPHENIIRVICLKDFMPVMEICDGGTLYDSLMKRDSNDQLKTLEEHQLQEYTLQLSKILIYLAKYDIIHHNITMKNLCFQQGKLQLIDFGLAEQTKRSWKYFRIKDGYAAPEIHPGMYHSNKVDVYSVGIIMYAMAFRGFPKWLRYPESGHPKSPFVRRKGEYFKFPPLKDFPNVSPEFRDWIVKCMEEDPEKRYSHADFHRRYLIVNWK